MTTQQIQIVDELTASVAQQLAGGDLTALEVDVPASQV